MTLIWSLSWITLGRDNTYILLNFLIKETVWNTPGDIQDYLPFQTGTSCGKTSFIVFSVSLLFVAGHIHFTNTISHLLFLKSQKLCSSLVRVGSMSVAPLGISCMADTAAFGSSSKEVIIRLWALCLKESFCVVESLTVPDYYCDFIECD